MKCAHIDLGGGVRGIVCTSGRKPAPKRCSGCGEPTASLQCDFELRKGRRKGKTCDAFICNRCATQVGPNLDHCPEHRKLLEQDHQDQLDRARRALQDAEAVARRGSRAVQQLSLLDGGEFG